MWEKLPTGLKGEGVLEKQFHMADAGLYNSSDLHVSKDIFCSSEVKMFESGVAASDLIKQAVFLP